MDDIVLLPQMDVLDSLALVKDRLGAVAAVVLDPWYNRGRGGVREDYREWLAGVLAASAAVADHVFLWGFPDTLGGLLGAVPSTHELLAWLTWHYKNCPSVVRGWRPSQQACLHIARRGAKTHPENFLNDDQRRRLRDGKMRFMPGPPTVLEAPLIVGFVGRKERTGHPAQKPLAVIEPLVMMSTAPGDVVVDPMCGSGTTGEACRRLGRRAVLSDASEEYTGMAAARLGAKAGRLPRGWPGAAAGGATEPGHSSESPSRPKAAAGIPHPIPYQGSKRRLASLIVDLFPPETDRLIEPFAGSAAVSIAAARLGRAGHFLLNDVHAPLIELWRCIVGNPQDMAARYREVWSGQLGMERAYYDTVRRRFNEQHRPEDFLYLLTRCVKAAIRYNSRGEFNNSPDNRRRGTHPDTMERHIRGASELLGRRTEFRASDYREVLSRARACDMVYMDPPYQGVCRALDHRYIRPVRFDAFVDALSELNARGIPFIVSYDGRTGSKRFGHPLPDELGLMRAEVAAGRSTQATLLGRSRHTYESLYLSPSLLKRNGGRVPGGAGPKPEALGKPGDV